MSGAQHTPGPWVTNGGVVRTADENNLTIKRIADICGPFGDPEKTANARLIAAAPDLLEASQDAVAILDVAIDLWNATYPNDPDEVLTDLQARFRAAVTRATGAA